MSESIAGSRITLTVDDNHGGAITGLQLDGVHLINSVNKSRPIQFGVLINDNLGVRMLTEAGDASALFADPTNSVLTSISTDHNTIRTVTQLGYTLDPVTTGLGDFSVSNSTISKTTTVDVDGIENLVMMDAVYRPEASTKLGTAVLAFGFAPVAGLDHLHIFDPATSLNAVAVNTLSTRAVPGDGGVIFANADGSVALGVYAFNSKAHTVSASAAAAETINQFGADAGRFLSSQIPHSNLGMDNSSYRQRQYIMAGSLVEVESAFRQIIAASAPGSSGVAAALRVTGTPGSVEVDTTFAISVEAISISADVVGDYAEDVTITANGPGTMTGTTTVAASGGVVTFNDLALDAYGSYSLTITSGDLLPTTIAMTVAASSSLLLSVKPNSYVTATDPEPVVVNGTGFTYPLNVSISGLPFEADTIHGAVGVDSSIAWPTNARAIVSSLDEVWHSSIYVKKTDAVGEQFVELRSRLYQIGYVAQEGLSCRISTFTGAIANIVSLVTQGGSPYDSTYVTVTSVDDNWWHLACRLVDYANDAIYALHQIAPQDINQTTVLPRSVTVWGSDFRDSSGGTNVGVNANEFDAWLLNNAATVTADTAQPPAVMSPPTGGINSFSADIIPLAAGTYQMTVSSEGSSASNQIPITIGDIAPPTPVADAYKLVLPEDTDVPTSPAVHVLAMDTAQFGVNDLAGLDTSYTGSGTVTLTSVPGDAPNPGPYTVDFIDGVASVPAANVLADTLTGAAGQSSYANSGTPTVTSSLNEPWTMVAYVGKEASAVTEVRFDFSMKDSGSTNRERLLFRVDTNTGVVTSVSQTSYGPGYTASDVTVTSVDADWWHISVTLTDFNNVLAKTNVIVRPLETGAGEVGEREIQAWDARVYKADGVNVLGASLPYDFSTWTATNSLTITSDTSEPPPIRMDADTLHGAAGSAGYIISDSASHSSSVAEDWVTTTYVKKEGTAITEAQIRPRLQAGGTTTQELSAYVDTNTGAVRTVTSHAGGPYTSAHVSVSSFDSNWWRVDITLTDAAGTATLSRVHCWPLETGGSTTGARSVTLSHTTIKGAAGVNVLPNPNNLAGSTWSLLTNATVTPNSTLAPLASEPDLIADGLYTIQTDATLTQTTGSYNLTNPQSTLTNLAPATGASGGGDVALTLTADFFPYSTVTAHANGVPLVTTYVNSTTVTAVLPGAFVALEGTVIIGTTTSNPALESNTLTYTATTAPPAATKLTIVGAPVVALTDDTFSVLVHVVDAQDNLITTATDTVTLTAPEGGLAGTLVVAAINGVATFPGLSFTTAGSKTLTADATSLTGDTSPVTISQPVPVLAQVLPTTYDTASVPANLSVTGSLFKTGIVAHVTDNLGGSADVSLTSVTSTTATLPIPGFMVAAGTYHITVENLNSSGVSNMVNVVITAAPVPSPEADDLHITVLPNSTTAPITFTVIVAAVDSSYLAGDPASVDSTYSGSVTLTADLPADAVGVTGLGAQAFVNGLAIFTVFSIYDGSYMLHADGALGSVNSAEYPITNPAIDIAGVTPPTIDQGSGTTDVLVSAELFFPPNDVTILVDGVPVTTVDVDLSTVRATIPASHFVASGSLAISADVANGPDPATTLTLDVPAVTPPPASHEENLPTSIEVKVGSWQRLRPVPDLQPTLSSSPLRDALREVGSVGQVYTEATDGASALDVVSIASGAYANLLFNGSFSGVDTVGMQVQPTADAPVVIRADAGASVAITPPSLTTNSSATIRFTPNVNHQHIHWYDIKVLSSTLAVATNSKSLNAVGGLLGVPTQKYSGIEFNRCDILGSWDPRVVALDGSHFMVAPITSIAQQQYDGNGDNHGTPLTGFTLDEIFQAIATDKYLSGSAHNQVGRAFFPGDPTEASHPNYSAELAGRYPTEAATPGLNYTGGIGTSSGMEGSNMWGLALRACTFTNFQYYGVNLYGLGADAGVGGNAVTVQLSYFQRCGHAAIQWHTGPRKNPLFTTSADYSTVPDGTGDTGGVGFGILQLSDCTITDNGYASNKYQVNGQGHTGLQIIQDNYVAGGYSADMAHLALMAGGGIRIEDSAQFSGSVLDHFYFFFENAAQTTVKLPWSTLIQYAGKVCPVAGLPSATDVCSYPYLVGSDPQSGDYPPVFSGTGQTADTHANAGLQQNGEVRIISNVVEYNRPNGTEAWAQAVADVNPYGAVADRDPIQVGGVRSLFLDQNMVRSSSSDFGVYLDSIYAGTHLSSLTAFIETSDVLNTFDGDTLFRYGGSIYTEGSLDLQLQGEDPTATPVAPPVPVYTIPIEAECDAVVDASNLTVTYSGASGIPPLTVVTGGASTPNPIGSLNNEVNLIAQAINWAVQNKTYDGGTGYAEPLGRFVVGVKGGNGGTLSIAFTSKNSSPASRIAGNSTGVWDNSHNSPGGLPYADVVVGAPKPVTSHGLELTIVGLDADAQMNAGAIQGPEEGKIYDPVLGQDGVQEATKSVELFDMKVRSRQGASHRAYYSMKGHLTSHFYADGIEFMPLDPALDGVDYAVTSVTDPDTDLIVWEAAWDSKWGIQLNHDVPTTVLRRCGTSRTFAATAQQSKNPLGTTQVCFQEHQFYVKGGGDIWIEEHGISNCPLHVVTSGRTMFQIRPEGNPGFIEGDPYNTPCTNNGYGRDGNVVIRNNEVIDHGQIVTNSLNENPDDGGGVLTVWMNLNGHTWFIDNVIDNSYFNAVSCTGQKLIKEVLNPTTGYPMQKMYFQGNVFDSGEVIPRPTVILAGIHQVHFVDSNVFTKQAGGTKNRALQWGPEAAMTLGIGKITDLITQHPGQDLAALGPMEYWNTESSAGNKLEDIPYGLEADFLPWVTLK